jgi:hypothetical protein
MNDVKEQHNNIIINIQANMVTKLLSILFCGLTVAFAPLPVRLHRITGVKQPTAILYLSNDDVITQLANEYRFLQNRLFETLQEEPRKKKDIDELTETMYEMASEMNSLKRYKQVETIADSEKEFKHAQGDLERAQALKAQYHMTGGMAEEEAAMIEHDDAEYEDLERKRDLSVSHAAHHIEEDANNLILEAQMHEYKAMVGFEDAISVLRELEENEKLLKETLKDIRKEHHQADAMGHWIEHNKPKHETFIRKAKDVITKYGGELIDHDPTKGNIAF